MKRAFSIFTALLGVAGLLCLFTTQAKASGGVVQRKSNGNPSGYRSPIISLKKEKVPEPGMYPAPAPWRSTLA